MSTILCIEDEAYLCQNIVEELVDAGYDVHHASDGQVGLEMILKHKPDLVLCDVTMPRKNGFELLREIRERYPLHAEMPFIFLSALADKDQVLAGLKNGADGYLTKPIDFEMLLMTILTSLRQMEQIKRMREKVLVLEV